MNAGHDVSHSGVFFKHYLSCIHKHVINSGKVITTSTREYTFIYYTCGDHLSKYLHQSTDYECRDAQ